jgi:hypothetical protein
MSSSLKMYPLQLYHTQVGRHNRRNLSKKPALLHLLGRPCQIKSFTNYFEVNDLFTWGCRFLVPNFQDSIILALTVLLATLSHLGRDDPKRCNQINIMPFIQTISVKRKFCLGALKKKSFVRKSCICLHWHVHLTTQCYSKTMYLRAGHDTPCNCVF